MPTITPFLWFNDNAEEAFTSYTGLFPDGRVLDTQRGPDGKPKHLPVWRIFDARYTHKLSKMYADKDPGFVRTAPTLEALAEKIGLDPARLRATVERFNGWSKEGVDRDFHRGETAWERYYTGDPKKGAALKPLEKPPFFASPFLYVSLGTKGGPRTNERCEVLRPDKSVIAGLYCAGIAWNCFLGNHISLFDAYTILQAFGCFLAWETRNVNIPALNDSKYIGKFGFLLSFILFFFFPPPEVCC